MKDLYITISILMFPLLYSCIEPYDTPREDTANEILIVQGQIVGDTECEFILQRSSCKYDDEEYMQHSPHGVPYATVYVVCSDGQVFGAKNGANGHYFVTLGHLDPNETYHLQINLFDEGNYSSEPMYPMPTTEIKQLSYTLSDDGTTVQMRITNEDPHGERYYLWTYDEHWEINTPLVTDWKYEPRTGKIVRVEQRTNHGWASKSNHPYIVGHNIDFGNGALKDYPIYSLSNMSNRFNTRYYTKVHQISISKREYEYYKQMETQTTQTGGIFTLMPVELPTNIRNDQGLRVVGYVGVHLNSSDAEIYINRDDVGYKPSRSPEIIPDSIVAKEPWIGRLYDRGYRVYHYDQVLDRSEWTEPWCIDCTDHYWGGTLDRPDFWEDN